MKKNKINLKLTACLVSLFIGIVLMILGNKSKYCLSFGMVFLAISSTLFSLYKAEENRETNKEIEQELEKIDETNIEHKYIEVELLKIQRKNNKKTAKVSFVFNMFAIIVVVLAIFAGI